MHDGKQLRFDRRLAGASGAAPLEGARQPAAGSRPPGRRRGTVGTVGIIAAVAGCVGGCGTYSSTSAPFEYRTESTRHAPLDIPPDLSSLPRDGRFAVPDRGVPDPAGAKPPAAGAAAGATAGASNDPGAAAPAAPASASASALASTNSVAEAAPRVPAPAVAPSASNARIERGGNQRWLAVDVPPETAYGVVKSFWPSVGLAIERDDPQAGVIETSWAENRAKIPLDVIRRTVGKVFDGLYSSGEQDRYRTRIERTPNNTTEIYVTQRKLVETYVGSGKDSTVWIPGPPDADLEVEMLQRLLGRFAPAAVPAPAVAVNAAAPAAIPVTQVPTFARLITASAEAPSRVEVREPFDRAWRRVGLALDRGGFTVEDRDRTRGLYFVRYLDPEYEAKIKSQQGLLARIFSSDPKIEAQQFRIQVAAAGEATAVTVQDRDGKPDASATAKRILEQVNEQLR
jgi:outer membrane protein assembly factor BamC